MVYNEIHYQRWVHCFTPPPPPSLQFLSISPFSSFSLSHLPGIPIFAPHLSLILFQTCLLCPTPDLGCDFDMCIYVQIFDTLPCMGYRYTELFFFSGLYLLCFVLFVGLFVFFQHFMQYSFY